MFFNKEKKKNNYLKTKTLESREKQKKAIASYYSQKKQKQSNK